MKFLNSKEVKHLRRALLECYGISAGFDYVFLLSGFDVYFAGGSVDFELHVHSVGIYFGEFKNGEIRLSIEGSQAVGRFASKNVLEVGPDVERMWMQGLDIPSEAVFEGWVIVKCGGDFLGCGRYKEGRILNHVPKERRVHC